MNDNAAFRESPVIAGFRFLLEVIAWVVIYFAWGLIALVLAVGALVAFGVPGDKHFVPVRVPGPVRFALEMTVALAGIAAAFALFGTLAAAVLFAATLLLIFVSYRRWVWIWNR